MSKKNHFYELFIIISTLEDISFMNLNMTTHKNLVPKFAEGANYHHPSHMLGIIDGRSLFALAFAKTRRESVVC